MRPTGRAASFGYSDHLRSWLRGSRNSSPLGLHASILLHGYCEVGRVYGDYRVLMESRDFSAVVEHVLGVARQTGALLYEASKLN